jgi:hypothetical protein
MGYFVVGRSSSGSAVVSDAGEIPKVRVKMTDARLFMRRSAAQIILERAKRFFAAYQWEIIEIPILPTKKRLRQILTQAEFIDRAERDRESKG